MAISCFAAFKPKQILKPFSYKPHALHPFEILVNITHCGICHSDIHLIDDDWGISEYPLVPGHEIIGLVEEMGKEVSHLKKGDRVGVGWQSASCMTCESCVRGEENFCREDTATCVGHFGGFAKKIFVDGRFAFKIPDNLDSAASAPLLCGGVTVFSPLQQHNVNAKSRVGVIGIGGLGHMALKFARAFNCELTAFSSTKEKEREAKIFGASRFVDLNDQAQLKKMSASLDLILSTTPVLIDFNQMLKILRPNGKLCVVGAVNKPIQISSGNLISGQKGIVGSVIGNRSTIREMLRFASRHNIGAQVEVTALAQVNEAIKRVRENKARYRIVLDMA